jgi:predicted RNase H-like HicB family nuclease
MKNTPCKIEIVKVEADLYHLRYYGYYCKLEDVWSFSKSRLGVEDAINEVLDIKFKEYQENMEKELSDGVPASEFIKYDRYDWFDAWGIWL